MPVGAWISNVSKNVQPSSSGDIFSQVVISWDPDPDIPLQQRAYRIVTRNAEVVGSPFVLSNNVSVD